ncbi:MAG: P-loop containing nucleoside triphosphate hydrolase protein, partial [Olpidium bornovanus]
MNERSSRSHTIFRLIIEGKDRDPVEGDLAVKRANLVDLAGSERASHTGAEGARLREGGNINKSLLALSTLTRILQTSLGGNARTAIICTITPASNYAEDTTSTLKFALRAKNVRVQPSVNEILNEDALVIRQKREITNLGKQLAAVTDELQVLRSQALAASCENRGDESPDSKKDESKPRRKTWGPGPPDDLDRDVKPPPPPPATGSAPPADSAADAEAEKTALRRDIEERDARIAELELDIQTVCERLTETESINEELSDQFRFFRAHLDVAKQACAQQGNDLAQARAECNRLAASLEEREREADETKSRLER